MKYLHKGFFIIAALSILSCKKEDYVLYPIDNACDSLSVKHTYFNSYTVTNKYRTVDAQLIKRNDSSKILELDLGPKARINKIIISKDTYALYPGLMDGNEFIVKKSGEKLKAISDSEWRLLKNCNSSLERFKKFKFNKDSQLFEFEALGSNDVFTYKTKDSVTYQLYLKIIKPADFNSQKKLVYDTDFVSIEFKLLANNMIKGTFYGFKIKDDKEIQYFSNRLSGPETVYFYKYNNN